MLHKKNTKYHNLLQWHDKLNNEHAYNVLIDLKKIRFQFVLFGFIIDGVTTNPNKPQ